LLKRTHRNLPSQSVRMSCYRNSSFSLSSAKSLAVMIQHWLMRMGQVFGLRSQWSNTLITSNLVLFKSIGTLQEQNQKLRIVRELPSKMESEKREYEAMFSFVSRLFPVAGSRYIHFFRVPGVLLMILFLGRIWIPRGFPPLYHDSSRCC
jgi:hypothetical protein